MSLSILKQKMEWSKNGMEQKMEWSKKCSKMNKPFHFTLIADDTMTGVCFP